MELLERPFQAVNCADRVFRTTTTSVRPRAFLTNGKATGRGQNRTAGDQPTVQERPNELAALVVVARVVENDDRSVWPK